MKSLREEIQETREMIHNYRLDLSIDDVTTVLDSKKDIPEEVYDILLLIQVNRQKELDRIRDIQTITLTRYTDCLLTLMETISSRFKNLETHIDKVETIAIDAKIPFYIKAAGLFLALLFIFFALFAVNPEIAKSSISAATEVYNQVTDKPSDTKGINNIMDGNKDENGD